MKNKQSRLFKSLVFVLLFSLIVSVFPSSVFASDDERIQLGTAGEESTACVEDESQNDTDLSHRLEPNSSGSDGGDRSGGNIPSGYASDDTISDYYILNLLGQLNTDSYCIAH